MLKDTEQYYEVGQLILKCLCGDADAVEQAELREHLENDPYAMQYYSEYVMLYSAMYQPGNVSAEPDKEQFDAAGSVLGGIWHELADEELIAEEVVTSRKLWGRRRRKKVTAKEPTVRQLVKKREVVKLRRQFSRMAIHTAVISTAAMLFIALLVWLDPQKGPVMARVTSSINAVWDDVASVGGQGSPMRSGRMRLFEGFVEFLMEGGAEVIVQGPAVVEMENDGQLFLQTGSLVSRVPPEAVGFIVRTPNATIVDYGTEFGVTAYPSGVTETYVFDGVVEIRAGSDPVMHGEVMRLHAGQGGRVDADGNVVVWNMDKQNDRYVRKMPEEGAFTSSGSRLDLADVVGGGNGFGSGKIGPVIDPVTGNILPGFSDANNRPGNGEYVTVPENSYIDGVFVPDGSNGFVEITSAGHVFTDCPDTSGMYWSEISNDAREALYNAAADADRRQVAFDGIEYGTKSEPAILIHANLGITFDLDEFRRMLVLQKIIGFNARCGISEPMSYTAKADFRVFVDGVERFEWTGVRTTQGLREINIELNDDDRFLTLVTTDGGDEAGIGRDWTVFVDPVLELKAIDEEFTLQAPKTVRSRVRNVLKGIGVLKSDQQNTERDKN